MRTERKLSQQKLADVSGISKQTIYCYECGKRSPTLKSLVCIRDVFDCSWEELLGGLES